MKFLITKNPFPVQKRLKTRSHCQTKKALKRINFSISFIKTIIHHLQEFLFKSLRLRSNQDSHSKIVSSWNVSWDSLKKTYSKSFLFTKQVLRNRHFSSKCINCFRLAIFRVALCFSNQGKPRRTMTQCTFTY